MPAGLLSPLKAEKTRDIPAYFEARGDPRHAVFK